LWKSSKPNDCLDGLKNVDLIMRTLMASLAIGALLCSGCSTTITKAEFDRKCNETVDFRNTVTGQVLYRGSKKGYDYFLFQPFGLFSHRARTKEGEVALRKRFLYTRDESAWLVVVPDRSGWTNFVIQPRGTNLFRIQMVKTNDTAPLTRQ
jgi:hypothetical protein